MPCALAQLLIDRNEAKQERFWGSDGEEDEDGDDRELDDTEEVVVERMPRK